MTGPARRFTIMVDEPPELGGNDNAPFPIEVVLAALAGCVTNATATNAALFDVPVDAIELDLEAHMDARGFMGHDKYDAQRHHRHQLHGDDPELGARGQGAPVQGDHRPEVGGAGHPRQPGEHHLQVRLQALVVSLGASDECRAVGL